MLRRIMAMFVALAMFVAPARAEFNKHIAGHLRGLNKFIADVVPFHHIVTDI